MSRPLKFEEMKPLKGQEVWLIPKNNSIDRSKSLIGQITSDIVVDLDEETFCLKKKGTYSFSNYLNSANKGFIPFKSKEDIFDYLLDYLIVMQSINELENLGLDGIKINIQDTGIEPSLYIGKRVWHIDEPYQVFEIVCKRDGRFYALNPHPAFVKAKLISENSLGKIFFETKEECLEARILRAKRELDLEIEYKEREG